MTTALSPGLHDVDAVESGTRQNSAISVSKALQLLDAFAGAGHVISVSQLARRVGLPKSTAFRLVTQLVDSGYVTRHGNKYALSLHAFELGNQYMRAGRMGLREIAAPHLGGLFTDAHFIVNLAMLDGIDIIFLDKIQGLQAPHAPSMVGGRAPALHTALGKALLAFSPADVTRDALRNHRPSVASRVAILPGLVAQQLQRAKDTGIAYDHEEWACGISCVAAPVLSDGQPVGAVSISGPSVRYQPEKVAHSVAKTAARIGQEFSRFREAPLAFTRLRSLAQE